jgi:ribosome-binding protein aMBF1 (putative translation factor)
MPPGAGKSKSYPGYLRRQECRRKRLVPLNTVNPRTLGEAVGAELTRLRVARGWSQQKLADELGYTERYIGQWNVARRAQPCEPSLMSRRYFRQSPL